MRERDPARPLHVTVWGENIHERLEDDVRARYPQGMHAAIADGIAALLGDSARTATATLQEPEHGLAQAVLDDTDVLTWWGHAAHDEVDDAVAERAASNHPRGDCGLPGPARPIHGAGAAHRTALAITRWTSEWW